MDGWLWEGAPHTPPYASRHVTLLIAEVPRQEKDPRARLVKWCCGACSKKGYSEGRHRRPKRVTRRSVPWTGRCSFDRSSGGGFEQRSGRDSLSRGMNDPEECGATCSREATVTFRSAEQ